MAKSGTRLGKATYVTYGYGQVEPNHLTLPQVLAQLPADKDIDLLENGQFVKYDYANGVCNFSTEKSAGAWYMVFNEVKIYRDRETDADFAMIKQNYNGRVYSPVGQTTSDMKTVIDYTGEAVREGTSVAYKSEIGTYNYPEMMPEGTKMVPRVIKIGMGDIWTTNTVMAEAGSLAKGDLLHVGADGYLTKTGADSATGGDTDPVFAVIKVYTTPDMQPGVKLQRVM